MTFRNGVGWKGICDAWKKNGGVVLVCPSRCDGAVDDGFGLLFSNSSDMLETSLVVVGGGFVTPQCFAGCIRGEVLQGCGRLIGMVGDADVGQMMEGTSTRVHLSQ